MQYGGMMGNPKLTVLNEKMRGQIFEIDRETMSVGRRDGMDICIKDSTLSGHHADIIRGDRDGKAVYILRDNDSTNGTKINNAPLSGERELKNADLILFGGIEVLFDAGESDDEFSSTTFQPTVTLDLGGLDSNLTTAPTLANLNPLAAEEQKKHKATRLAIIAVLGVVGLALLVVVAVVLVRHFTASAA